MNRREDEQKEGEWEKGGKLEKGERDRARAGVRFMESTYPEIYESVAGNETDAEKRGGKNGRERAAGLR